MDTLTSLVAVGVAILAAAIPMMYSIHGKLATLTAKVEFLEPLYKMQNEIVLSVRNNETRIIRLEMIVENSRNSQRD